MLLWSSALAASPLRVSAQLGDPGPDISPGAITGFNVGLAMQFALHLSEFQALDIHTLRFPPGNDADNYPLTRNMVEALKVQWQLLGEPELLIVTNFFEGAEHAQSAARSFDETGIPVHAWAIGNEPDLYPRNRMDPSWTVEVYCDRFRSVAEVLREIDPEAVISGPAVSGSRPLGETYLRDFLTLCGDVIDVLSWHIYPTDGTWDDEAALATSQQVGEEIQRYRSWLRDPEINPLGYERDIGLAITEFGLSWRTPNFRHLEDMIAALWLADALGQMATEGVTWGHYFALQAMGGHGLIARGGWLRPTYTVYEMLAGFTGRTRSIELDNAPALLGAYAAENEDGLRVLIVNRGTEDIEVVLEPTLGSELEVKTLSDEIFDEALSYQENSQLADEAIAVPARSVVVVRSAP